jgi:ABC-type xylose transport system substrate-binding protein
MAIRTTFTAGEILTAADLTDTFGAKSPVASPTFTGTVTLPESIVGAPAPNRNLLYNGAMQVAQRGTSTASITASGFYTADRWTFAPTSMGTWTQTNESDGPTGSGFVSSCKVL